LCITGGIKSLFFSKNVLQPIINQKVLSNHNSLFTPKFRKIKTKSDVKKGMLEIEVKVIYDILTRKPIIGPKKKH